MTLRKVLVFGAGNFGSCLADHLADSEHTVYLWARSREVVNSINTTHRHPKYLKDHDFPESIKAVGPELPSKEFLSEMDVVLFAIPTQYLRNALLEIKDLLDEENLPLLIFVNKGIETGTRALTLEIIADTLGQAAAKTATFLSGPSFAKEIVQRQPTQVSVTSMSIEHAQRTAEVFHQPWFRCYTGDDPIGVELAGALKNVYAIAAGISDGLGYQNNTRAGLITRCLAEMTRVGCAYGASPLTFLSLAGVGDLFLTCSSRNSRNYTVGYRLGQGEKLDVIIDTLGSVAEGVATAQGLHEIIERLGAEAYAPIAEGVYAVLYDGQTAEEMSHWLMNQPAAQRELEIPERAAPYEAIMLKLGLEAKKIGKI